MGELEQATLRHRFRFSFRGYNFCGVLVVMSQSVGEDSRCLCVRGKHFRGREFLFVKDSLGRNLSFRGRLSRLAVGIQDVD